MFAKNRDLVAVSLFWVLVIQKFGVVGLSNSFDKLYLRSNDCFDVLIPRLIAL